MQLSDGVKKQPINVIISNKSDASVLKHIGLMDYFKSLGYDLDNCMTGAPNNQTANVSNGTYILNRFNYNWHSAECETSRGKPVLYLHAWTQNRTNEELGALFIAATVLTPDKQGDKVEQNGYDRGRDLFVSRATLDYSNNYIGSAANKSMEYKTQVVYNDTQLLANMPKDLDGAVTTDGRVPILLVEHRAIPSDQMPISYPGTMPMQQSGQSGRISYLSSVPTVAIAAMIVLSSLTFTL